MLPVRTNHRQGFTLVEIIVVIAVVIILMGFFMPVMHRSETRAKAGRIVCVNNLKNIGLGMRIFAGDHGGKFPMDLPASQGGTRELNDDASRIWQHYLALTNELTIPKLLWCPKDSERTPATTFAPNPANRRAVVFAGNQHLSYFLGLNAAEDRPETILAGDRNLTTNGTAVGPGRLVLTTNMILGYSDQIHQQAGNILLGDGSVQQVTSSRLDEHFRAALTNSSLITNVWLVP